MNREITPTESESRRGNQGRAVETAVEGMGNKKGNGELGEPEERWRFLSREQKTMAIGSPWGQGWHLLVTPGQEEDQFGTSLTACEQPRRCFVGDAV